MKKNLKKVKNKQIIMKNQVSTIQTILQKSNQIKTSKSLNKYQNHYQKIHLLRTRNQIEVIQKVYTLKILKKLNLLNLIIPTKSGMKLKKKTIKKTTKMMKK